MARRVYIPRGKREQIPEIGAEVAFKLRRDDCDCSISQLVPSEKNPLAWPWPEDLVYKAIISCRKPEHHEAWEAWMMTVLQALNESPLPDGSDVTEILVSAVDIWSPP